MTESIFITLTRFNPQIVDCCTYGLNSLLFIITYFYFSGMDNLEEVSKTMTLPKKT